MNDGRRALAQEDYYYEIQLTNRPDVAGPEGSDRLARRGKAVVTGEEPTAEPAP